MTMRDVVGLITYYCMGETSVLHMFTREEFYATLSQVRELEAMGAAKDVRCYECVELDFADV